MRVYKNEDIKAESTAPMFKVPYVKEIGEYLLKDKRDLPLLEFMCNIVLGPFPLMMTMLFIVPTIPYVSALIAITYTIVLVVTGFSSKYVLATHYAFHRPIFKGTLMKAIHDHLLCILGIPFGFMPGLYRLHHCVMHHIENNGKADISSTEEYERGKISGLLKYMAVFLFGVFFYLPYYAITRQLWGAFGRWAFWRVVHTTFIVIAYRVNPTHTMYFCIIPMFIMGMALSIGNYFQHILVDPDNSRCNYHLTYNIINTVDNQQLFNDCYHITHHINSQIHWTEMPAEFDKKVMNYAQNDALVFEGITIGHVGYYVLAGKFEALADYIVELPGAKKRTQKEWAKILEHRTKPLVSQ
mmetsp:Transcript_9183/g.13586  ORF Transcript_9183/g.13586 Transcript_9183/m.13586 type:complete len:355 (+) Transcript_9183:11-1075(+)